MSVRIPNINTVRGDIASIVAVLKDAVVSIRMLSEGRGNAGGTVTLTASTTTTTVTHQAVGANASISFMPTTANAAAEIGNGTLYVPTATVATGSFVITHANNAQVDRTFRWSATNG